MRADTTAGFEARRAAFSAARGAELETEAAAIANDELVRGVRSVARDATRSPALPNGFDLDAWHDEIRDWPRARHAVEIAVVEKLASWSEAAPEHAISPEQYDLRAITDEVYDWLELYGYDGPRRRRDPMP